MILRLKKGEEITEEIASFCQQNQIDSAWIEAIGAISSAEIAFYNLKEKTYIIP